MEEKHGRLAGVQFGPQPLELFGRELAHQTVGFAPRAFLQRVQDDQLDAVDFPGRIERPFHDFGKHRAARVAVRRQDRKVAVEVVELVVSDGGPPRHLQLVHLFDKPVQRVVLGGHCFHVVPGRQDVVEVVATGDERVEVALNRVYQVDTRLKIAVVPRPALGHPVVDVGHEDEADDLFRRHRVLFRVLHAVGVDDIPQGIRHVRNVLGNRFPAVAATG